MKTIHWYFDFISPFAYLALRKVERLSTRFQICYHPVLFAGLLEHWGNKGPAEIDPKRVWTYRWCTWKAASERIPFRFPAAHPFNPLPYLRLAIAADNEPTAVRAIFEGLWNTGADPADEHVLLEMIGNLGIEPASLGSASVKEQLRRNTAEAAEQGIFGVPTLAIDGEIFWGLDGMDFAQACLDDDALLTNDEMIRVSRLPVGLARKI